MVSDPKWYHRAYVFLDGFVLLVGGMVIITGIAAWPTPSG
jgi:hypothetical protein